MSHYFVKIDSNNIVTQVIVAEQDVINSGLVGDPSLWIETSYNGDFRKQYAGIGFTYDKVNDIFIAPIPHASWILDASFDWQPPFASPVDDYAYMWNESIQDWDKHFLYADPEAPLD